MDNRDKFADRACGVSASLTLVISARAKKMQSEGIRVINFTVGEPDFDTPTYITTAAKKAIDDGKTRYTASAGILPLREAIAAKLLRDNGLKYSASQIVVSNGAKQSLYNVMQALVNPGDEVIVPAPYWLTYTEVVRLAGGVPVVVNAAAENGFKVTAEQIKRAITGKTKAIIINSPNNPTGAVYSEAELRAIAAVCEDSGIWVISDEIYENLRYGAAKHWSIAKYSEKLYKKTVVINGMSKTYAMTGWRVGYCACAPGLAAVIDNMQSHMTSNVNTIAQYAALEAIGGDGERQFVEQMVAEFDKRRRYMLKRLGGMPHITFVVPDGAFYVMVGVGKIGSGLKVAEELIEKARIAVVPGEAFGADGYIRLSYTVSMEDIEAGLDELEKYLESHVL